MSTVRVHPGDCLDVLRTMPDSSIHAVVTDPPYGLSNTDPAHVVETLTRWAAGERDYVPTGKGFMGKAWDAFVPPPAVWDECLRVLKPGGHLLAFAGSRTSDLMTLSIRFAGFDIRDGIAWLYGSGFPKSLDVSKAIDKAAGAKREVVGKRNRDTNWRGAEEPDADRYAMTGANDDRGGSRVHIPAMPRVVAVTAPATDDARTWQGWGTALKPAFEPVVVARKPLAGTVAANVLAHGTGALNIDATKTEAGRWPTNVVLDGHAADALDEQTGNLSVNGPATYRRGKDDADRTVSSYAVERGAGDVRPGYGDAGGASRFFPTFRDQETTCPTFSTPFTATSAATPTANGAVDARGWRTGTGSASTSATATTSLSASDLPTFRYQAKAPTRERPSYEREDGTRVAHPTVKPVELMRWLVRLVTPPGGTVLDPFAGSGATVEAALLEGFDVIAVEREPEYLPLIDQRIARANPSTPEDTDQ